jgi:hypothetical protein
MADVLESLNRKREECLKRKQEFDKQHGITGLLLLQKPPKPPAPERESKSRESQQQTGPPRRSPRLLQEQQQEPAMPPKNSVDLSPAEKKELIKAAILACGQNWDSDLLEDAAIKLVAAKICPQEVADIPTTYSIQLLMKKGVDELAAVKLMK